MGILQVLKTTKNGDVDAIEGYFKELQTENMFLKSVIQRMDAQLTTVVQKMDDVIDHVTKASAGVEEVRTIDYYGKKRVLLPQSLDNASKLTNTEIRSLIHRAARSHGKGKYGYRYIYSKLKDVTGIDVYSKGKIALKGADGIDGWKKDPSYINTILKYEVQKEAAVVAMEILNRK